jgi:hypothetical protein
LGFEEGNYFAAILVRLLWADRVCVCPFFGFGGRIGFASLIGLCAWADLDVRWAEGNYVLRANTGFLLGFSVVSPDGP